MNFLAQFWHAVAKVFDLPRRLRGLTDHRQAPRISAPDSLDHVAPGGGAARAFVSAVAEGDHPPWDAATLGLVSPPQ